MKISRYILSLLGLFWAERALCQSVPLPICTAKNKCIYVDQQSNPVFDQEFLDAEQFHFGLAVAETNEGIGAIDLNGDWVIPPDLTIRKFSSFDSNGLAIIRSQTGEFIINANNRIISPDKIRYIGREQTSFGLFYTAKSENDLYGVLDKEGNWKVKPSFTVPTLNISGYMMTEENGKWGVVNINNEVIVAHSFDAIASLTDFGFAAKVKNKWGVVDFSGNWVLPPSFDNEPEFSKINLISISFHGIEFGNKFGLMNLDGSWAIKPKFYWPIFGFDEHSPGLAVAAVRPEVFVERIGPLGNVRKVPADHRIGMDPIEWGIINTEGEWALPPEDRRLWPIRNGVAISTGKLSPDEKSGYGLINTKGEWVVPPFSNGLIRTSDGFYQTSYKDADQNERSGFFDLNGKTIGINPEELRIPKEVFCKYNAFIWREKLCN